LRVVFLLQIMPLYCFGQPSVDLAKYQSKYPQNPVVLQSQKLDASIELIKNQPKISFNSYSCAFVLAENSNLFSNSKEYFSKKFVIKKLEAYTLVPVNDKYKKIPVTEFIKTSEIQNGLFYDDQYAYNYSFPSVSKGSRLVENSEAWTDDPFIPITFYFGENKPVEEEVFTLTFPNSVDIKYYLFGNDTSNIKLTITHKGEQNIYQWKTSINKVYTSDAHSPSYEYYVPHVIVQIAGYWSEGKYKHVLGNIDDFYTYCYSKISNLNQKESDEIKHLTDSITANQTSDREKVRNIFKWVQKNIKYIAIEDGDNGVVPGEASVVLHQRYGDCKDKTSLLNAMIRSQGLNASFVWLGSRAIPYKYSDIPSPVVDNHMIAVWWDENNKPLILDGTTENHRMEDVPAFIQGKQCLISKGPSGYELYDIPIASPDQNSITDSLFVEIKGNNLTGKAIFNGEPKATMITRFDGIDTSKYRNVITSSEPKASNKFIVNAVKISDLTDFDQPFIVNYCFALPDYFTAGKESNYINLNIERFLQDINIQQDRKIPFENDYTLTHKYVCIFKISEDYKILDLPVPVGFENPKFGFHQQYSSSNDQIVLTSTVTLNFLNIYGPDISLFREMLRSLNQAYLKSIILNKKQIQ
jgi:transglutaminase-like putative cysteine protease